MDFQQLLAKMAQLDQPVGETVVPECGEPMGMTPPMGGNMGKPDTPPPSMSVNLNAQGMDNIEQLLKLVTKVNPDMEKPAMPPLGGMGGAPAIEIEPMDKPGGAMPKLGGLGNLGNLDSGPLKMLPDLDADNDDMPGGEKDMMPEPIDRDGEEDGEEDNDKEKEATDNRDAYQRDFDASQTGFGPREREDDEGEDEAFGNSVGDSEPDTMDIDASIPSGDDLHKQKSMHRAAAGGDNPMAAESTDLRSQIRAELLQRLAEAKGAK
jgi:hypothetical protein